MPDRSSPPSLDAVEDDRQEAAEQPSIQTIVERIRARSEAAGQSSRDAQGCDPFARSNFLSDRLASRRAARLVADCDRIGRVGFASVGRVA